MAVNDTMITRVGRTMWEQARNAIETDARFHSASTWDKLGERAQGIWRRKAREALTAIDALNDVVMLTPHPDRPVYLLAMPHPEPITSVDGSTVLGCKFVGDQFEIEVNPSGGAAMRPLMLDMRGFDFRVDSGSIADAGAICAAVTYLNAQAARV